jgi:hypothetical protein
MLDLSAQLFSSFYFRFSIVRNFMLKLPYKIQLINCALHAFNPKL